jgi:hypothetical protein
MLTTEVLKACKDEARLRQQHRFKDYLLENVYLRTTKLQRTEIMALWHDGGFVIDGGQAEHRAREVVFLVRTASGELAGVSEAALVRVRGHRRFYAYTMFLRKSDRVPYLMLAVLNGTRDFLRNFEHPRLQPHGMLLVTENRKLMRPGMRKLLARHKYRYWGRTAWGDDVWAVEFGQPDKAPPTYSGTALCGVDAQASARFRSAPGSRRLFDSTLQT